MRNYALGLGLPADAARVEVESHSTEQNAQLTGQLLRAAGLKRAVVVSDPYHLFRARQVLPRRRLRGRYEPRARVGAQFGFADAHALDGSRSRGSPPASDGASHVGAVKYRAPHFQVRERMQNSADFGRRQIHLAPRSMLMTKSIHSSSRCFGKEATCGEYSSGVGSTNAVAVGGGRKRWRGQSGVICHACRLL